MKIQLAILLVLAGSLGIIVIRFFLGNVDITGINRHSKILEYVEKNTNIYLKIFSNVETVPIEKNDRVLFKVGHIWVDAQSSKENRKIYLNQRIKVFGRPQIKVLNKYFREIWLIDPEITDYELLPVNEQKRFSGQRFYLGKIAVFFDLFRCKSEFIFLKSLPDPQGSLMAGIVLGTNQFLDWEFWQALKKTGTLHVIAASGMNVTILSKIFLDFLVKFINRKIAYLLVLFIILFYCLTAGASPAIIRAGLMAGLTLFGLAFGRESTGGWLLFLTAVLMLIFNPQLLFNVSFQLSVTAMVGMIYLRPMIEGLVFKKKGIHSQHARKKKTITGAIGSYLKNNTLDTFSAQLATTPVLYFTFGQIQFLSFLPNIMVLIVVPTLMIIGLSMLLLGLIWLPLAQPVAFAAWPLLNYFVQVIKWWAKIL